MIEMMSEVKKGAQDNVMHSRGVSVRLRRIFIYLFIYFFQLFIFVGMWSFQNQGGLNISEAGTSCSE